MPTRTDVTDMFIDLVKKGYITPPDQMERMPLPGAYPHVPTILGYTTPEAPIRDGEQEHAELEQRPQRDLYRPGD